MHATEFLQNIPESLPGVIVLTGDERTLKLNVEQAVIAAVLQDDDDTPARFSGQDTDFKTVRDELLTISMWGDRRLVIVEDAADFVSAHRSALETYAEKPARKSLLVLDVKSMPRNTRLYKIVSKAGLIVECTELKGAALSRWIAESLQKRFAQKIDADASTLLVELVGANLGVLEQELAKLASYVGELPRIDAEAVRRLVGGWKAETTWAMTDAIRDGQPGVALNALEKLLNAGESPHRILGGIGYVFRKLVVATELSRQGIPLKAALKKAGVFPGEVESSSRYLRRLGRPQAEQISDWLLAADTSLKGGSRISERTQLEILVVQLSGRLSP